MENSQGITLASVKDGLSSYYLALGLLAEECYQAEAGSRLLGTEPGTAIVSIGELPLDQTILGAQLPIWYRYAIDGVATAGFRPYHLLALDSEFDRLKDLLGVINFRNPYFEEFMGVIASDQSLEHLAHMVHLAEARANLDEGHSLTVNELSLLADMNERSVQNATSAAGESRLMVDERGVATNAEARRWLAKRRGFKPTQIRELRAAEEVPDNLLDEEIPPFVRRRLSSIWSNGSDASPDATWRDAAAKEAGMSRERLDIVTNLPMTIVPQECAGLSRAMRVDKRWFTLQVMTALYAEEVTLLLEPEHPTPEKAAERNVDLHAVFSSSVADETADSIRVTLTETMLRHGYIDIPMSARSMFPEDALGTRQAGDEGEKVELVYGGRRDMTDIRQKSQQTLSPRKRFTAWLNTELAAKPGDGIDIQRTGPRQYTLTYVAA